MSYYGYTEIDNFKQKFNMLFDRVLSERKPVEKKIRMNQLVFDIIEGRKQIKDKKPSFNQKFEELVIELYSKEDYINYLDKVIIDREKKILALNKKIHKKQNLLNTLDRLKDQLTKVFDSVDGE